MPLPPIPAPAACLFLTSSPRTAPSLLQASSPYLIQSSPYLTTIFPPVRHQVSSKQYTVMVRDLPPDTTASELVQHFSPLYALDAMDAAGRCAYLFLPSPCLATI